MAPLSKSGRQTKISTFFIKTPVSEKKQEPGIRKPYLAEELPEPKTTTPDSSNSYSPGQDQNPSTLLIPDTITPSSKQDDRPGPEHSPDSDEDIPDISPSLDANSCTGLALPESSLPIESSAAAQDTMSHNLGVGSCRTMHCGSYTITPITAASMTSFGRLLKTLLPVAYPPRFFTDILATGSLLGRIAVWHDCNAPNESIGGIKGRLEDVDPASAGPQQVDEHGIVVVEQQLYIQTLGVLAPYRGYGIAASMLDAVVDEALQASGLQQQQVAGRPPVRTKVTSVYAHVWEANEDALGWYKRRGFTVEEFMDSYYSKLKPPGAWVVRKRLDGN